MSIGKPGRDIAGQPEEVAVQAGYPAAPDVGRMYPPTDPCTRPRPANGFGAPRPGTIQTM